MRRGPSITEKIKDKINPKEDSSLPEVRQDLKNMMGNSERLKIGKMN